MQCILKEHNTWTPVDPCGSTESSIAPGGAIYVSLRICGNGSKWNKDNDSCMPVVERFRDRRNTDTCFGNPIAPLTGAKRHSVKIADIFGFPFSIEYDSRRLSGATQSAKSHAAIPPANLDGVWESNFQRQLFHAQSYIQAYRGGKNWSVFKSESGQTYSDIDPQSDDRVTYDGTTALLFDRKAGVIEKYSRHPGGWQEKILHTETRRADGHHVSYEYSSIENEYGQNPKIVLEKVKDPFGRTATFNYERPASAKLLPRLTGISLPNGASIAFNYNEGGMLAGIVWPGGATRQFLYERADLPWALTGVIDENGERTSSFAYDDNGLATETVLANGANAYRASWDQAPSLSVTESTSDGFLFRDIAWTSPQNVTVSGPLGRETNIGVVDVAGVPRVRTIDQPGGSGCNASTSAMAYDARGNITQKDDFNGSRSCSAYAATRNVESERVEGLSSGSACSQVLGSGKPLPTGARKTSTEWHPDWETPIRVAVPKKISTYVYNGQPDPFNGGAIASCAPATALLPNGAPIVVLCKQVEQATSDANGSAGLSAGLLAGTPPRSYEFTYNSRGRLLSSKDPLGNTTSYDYYTYGNAVFTVGDLNTSTNALGHVTKYYRYDMAGQPLEIIDPNQVVTYYTYDQRQRVSTTTVAGAITKYEYWPTGHLRQITLPDLSFIRYEYDGAGRLKAITDKAGNRIEYTLDDGGNRIGEQVKDPGGVLTRQLARVMDALGRVQQVTGRE